ncbi:MAG: hypothetical protein HOI96_05225, partial [Rhodospirillaceae bacterium]|nr:hypothetical protein [Rhodospirillaceae bacterium]
MAEGADNLQVLIEQAVAYQQESRSQEAERAYRAALELDPGHPGVLHNLGALV